MTEKLFTIEEMVIKNMQKNLIRATIKRKTVCKDTYETFCVCRDFKEFAKNATIKKENKFQYILEKII